MKWLDIPRENKTRLQVVDLVFKNMAISLRCAEDALTRADREDRQSMKDQAACLRCSRSNYEAARIRYAASIALLPEGHTYPKVDARMDALRSGIDALSERVAATRAHIKAMKGRANS